MGEHPDTALSTGKLASNLDAQGKHAQAEPLHRQALELRRKLLGEEHPDTAESYNNLALNLRAQGKYAEAEPLFQTALTLVRKRLGEEHPLTALSYNNLASDLYDLGKYAEAESLLYKVITVDQKRLGDEHPHTAASYNDLAAVLRTQGRYAEAEPLYHRALAIRRKVLGEEHPDTASGYSNLAQNLYAQGKYAEAESLFRRALELRRKLLGEEHPLTADSYDNLAASLAAQSRHAEALPLYQKALALVRERLGEEHPRVLRRKLLTGEHPDTALSCNALAVDLRDQGKYAEAEPLFHQALTVRRKLLGEEHPDTAATYYSLALNLYGQGRYAEAEQQLTHAARSFASARLRTNVEGLDRAAFTMERSPLPALAAVLARRGMATLAWQHWEANLARGLLDDLSGRQTRTLTRQELQREQELCGRLHNLEIQIARWGSRSSLVRDCTDTAAAGLVFFSIFEGTAGPADGSKAVLQGVFQLGRSQLHKAEELVKQRLTTQAELSQFEQELVGKYGLAPGRYMIWPASRHNSRPRRPCSVG